MSLSERLNQIIQKLNQKGIRVTQQRKKLAFLFLQTHRFLSSVELYSEMSKYYPGLSYNTVYRNVRLFKELNIIEHFSFEDGIRFRINCQEQDHYHLICLGCETTIPIDFSHQELQIGLPDRFNPVKYKFDIYGYCLECSNENSGARRLYPRSKLLEELLQQ